LFHHLRLITLLLQVAARVQVEPKAHLQKMAAVVAQVVQGAQLPQQAAVAL
jgi:hypothetical protein